MHEIITKDKKHQNTLYNHVKPRRKKSHKKNEHVKNFAEALPLSITQHHCSQMQPNLRRNKTATNFTPSSSNLATVDFKVAFSAEYFTQSKFKLAFSFKTDCFSDWTSFSWASFSTIWVSFSTIWACKDFGEGRGSPLRIRRLRPVFKFHCTKQ